VPEERLKSKGLAHPGERVTSLVEATGKTVPMEVVKMSIVRAMSEALGLEPGFEELTGEELDKAKDLVKTKYGSDEWNLKKAI
jgi:lipoate-protein ligase A